MLSCCFFLQFYNFTYKLNIFFRVRFFQIWQFYIFFQIKFWKSNNFRGCRFEKNCKVVKCWKPYIEKSNKIVNFWSSKHAKRNSLTTMTTIGHGDLRVYSKLTQGHFLQSFTCLRRSENVILRPCMSWYVLTNPFLDGTVFALAFSELWERTNWHPVSNTQRHCK